MCILSHACAITTMSPPSLPPALNLPPPPIDPRALPPYASSERAFHAISAAYSYTHNRRNLENSWYPPHQISWSDITDFKFSGTMHLSEQFSLWLSNAELEHLALLSLADELGDGASDDEPGDGGSSDEPESDPGEDELELPDSGSDFEPSLSSTRTWSSRLLSTYARAQFTLQLHRNPVRGLSAFVRYLVRQPKKPRTNSESVMKPFRTLLPKLRGVRKLPARQQASRFLSLRFTSTDTMQKQMSAMIRSPQLSPSLTAPPRTACQTSLLLTASRNRCLLLQTVKAMMHGYHTCAVWDAEYAISASQSLGRSSLRHPDNPRGMHASASLGLL